MNDHWQSDFIPRRRVARLATIDLAGQPHAVPIVYAWEEGTFFTPIDEKPKEVGAYELQRVKNIQFNPHVAVIIDEYQEDWSQLAWVQLRGKANIETEGEIYQRGIRLLEEKYPQYAQMPLQGQPLIVIQVEEMSSWQAS